MSNMNDISQKEKPTLKLLLYSLLHGSHLDNGSHLENFCKSGKSLSQGTHMPNMKALSKMVQKATRIQVLKFFEDPSDLDL